MSSADRTDGIDARSALDAVVHDQWRISLGLDPRELLKRETLSDRLTLLSDDSGVLEKFERHFHGGSLIGGMYELLRRSLTSDIEIQRQLSEDTWFMRADPGQPENAVVNLVINARDAMPHVPMDLPHGSETLLVVEDSTAVEILASLGYRVLEAANGHHALERFMQHPDIALVFTDIMLPGGLLGTQLAEKLGERRPELNVLLTSGCSDSSLMHRSMLDGSVDLLPKPYQVAELARRVRAQLDGKEENQRVPA